MGAIVLRHRQNLKRNIPRSFYRIIAQKLQVYGLLPFNDYDNLLGDYRAKYNDCFYRYADYYDQQQPDKELISFLKGSWFYIPGIELKDEDAKEAKKAAEHRPYETFIPLKTGERLMLFTNTHEAVSYMQRYHLPVADYYFCIPFSSILTIMDNMHADEAILMPLCINKHLKKHEIEDLWH